MEIKQVVFRDPEDLTEKLGGIMVNNNFIICGCCGYRFDVSEIGEGNYSILPWVNIEEEIRGDVTVDGGE